SGSPTVWNNTFYSNTADSGGGVYIASGSPVISNTIIVNNANYGIYRSAGTPALAYNDVWGNVPANRFGVSAGTGSISADPRFVDQAAYDLHLRGASPCIDAGDPNTTLNADRDGNLRPLLSGYDIGAYEYGLMSAKTVATTADPGAVITYTIVVTNTGSASRTIPVTDTLHLYLDYAGLLTYTAGSGEYIAASRTVSWTGPVGGNSTAYITFTARITDWLAVGVPITNVAWVDFAATSVVTTTANSVPGTRHVAQTAASTDVHNNCRVTWKPCTTVQWAVDQALTGDGVRVATGVYTDVLGAGQVVSVSKSITLTGGYTFTIWAYSPDVYATTLEAQGGGQGMVITGPVTVTVAGFRVANATDGVMVYTATAVISRCRVYSNSGDGIHVTGGAFTLERTWVYSNTGDGVEVEGGTYAWVNNVVAHNEGAGLRTAGSEGTLKHNTFARNDVAGAVISNTARFTNTIFYSHTVGVSVTTGSTAYLSYTVWYSNTANQGTLISSTNYYSNPLFYDPEGLNYHIQSGSGALDTGVEAGVSEDIDGGPRPLLAGPDIGADEFPLRVTKGAPSTADPGQIITYTITLEGDATGLVLTDTLPTYVDYVSDSVTCSVGTTCGYLTAQRAITWTGNITSGQPAYITYTARITTWLAAGVQVVNDADVQLGDDLLHTAPVATTINGVPGTRYVAT
nr:DUF11 domain-containing protein [Anaerolineae bacterium]